MTSTLKVDQIQLADGSVPTIGDLAINDSGTVLDHHYMQYGTGVTLSNGAYTDTGLSLSVTPKSTSSKFIISYNVFLYLQALTNGWRSAAGRIMRDSTAIHTDAYSLGRGAIYGIGGSYTHIMINSPDTYVDAPNTTSEITYKVQLASYTGQTVYVHQAGQKGFLSITEIAG